MSDGLQSVPEIRDVFSVSLKHVPVTDSHIIGLNVIGSHVWGMNHEGSDVDTMAFVQEPTSRILCREGKLQNSSLFKSHTDHGWPVDIHVHEIGRTVDFLLKGNINFIVGVLSPIVVHSTPYMVALRGLVVEHAAKNVYDSVHGMAVQNMARYANIPRNAFYSSVLDDIQYTPIEPKRCRKMLAYLEFGIRWLSGEGVEFHEPTQYDYSTHGVVEAIKDLDIAYVDSGLPDAPNSNEFRDWLLDIRVRDLEVE